MKSMDRARPWIGSLLALLGSFSLVTAQAARGESALLVERAKLVVPELPNGGNLGWSVAVSGDTLVAGAPDFTFSGTGSAFVFVKTGAGWSLEQKLAIDDATVGGFGWSVAVAGDTIVVGAPFNTSSGIGAAFLFQRSGTTWSLQQKLEPIGAMQGSYGESVALSGDTALVGASGDWSTVPLSGAAYVFVRDGATWNQQQKLAASDAAIYHFFGFSVALDGDTAVIGDPKFEESSAYVFEREGTLWTQKQKFTENDRPGDNFGHSTAVQGGTIAVGTSCCNSAYVFVRSGDDWNLEQRLRAEGGSDLAAGFGGSVAVSGETVFGGDEFNNTSSGAVFRFARSGTSWNQEQKLIAQDFRIVSLFGNSVAASGETVVIGSRQAYPSGAVYVFGPDAPPDCSQAAPSVAALWPPDHRFATVAIQGLTDPDGDPITTRIDQIFQDEATKGTEEGNACPDAQGIGSDVSELRAERSGSGDGRVYTVSFTATDDHGASCQGTVRVCVPSHPGGTCRDGGPLFDSTLCAGSAAP